jgi:hypothetical protein
MVSGEFVMALWLLSSFLCLGSVHAQFDLAEIAHLYIGAVRQ